MNGNKGEELEPFLFESTGILLLNSAGFEFWAGSDADLALLKTQEARTQESIKKPEDVRDDRRHCLRYFY